MHRIMASIGVPRIPLAHNPVLPWDHISCRPAPATPLASNDKPVPALFKPITVRNMNLKNRVVVSPMCMYSSKDGLLNQFHVAHLGQFALHGAGLVYIEATSVSHEGRISPYDSGIWSDDHIEPIKKVADIVHSQGAKICIQIGHAGRKASTLAPFFQAQEGHSKVAAPDEQGGWSNEVIAPSAIPFDTNWITPKEMSVQQIKKLVQQFREAAVRAEKAGVDAIEIHGAHGYAICEFLSPLSNQRTDEYGGSFENRIRILHEIIDAIRSVWKEKPLFLRISAAEFVEGGWTIDDSIRLAGEVKNKIDMLDCSSSGNSPLQKLPPLVQGYQVPLAAAIKKAHPDLLIGTVGLIMSPTFANTVIENGDADFVLLAREFLRNPAWTQHAARELDYDIAFAPQYARAKPHKR